jgi:hypothetical protein
MTAGAFSKLVPAGTLPPRKVSVQSSAGGVDTDDVAILPGLTDAKPFPPVAVPDVLTTNLNAAASINVTANDAFTPPALVAQVVIVQPPLNGSAAPIGINTGVVTYTPTTGFFGADSFTYALEDSTGALSNIATVSVTVNRTAIAPIAADDSANTRVGVAIAIPVLANDSAANGTLDPASVTIVGLPKLGNVTRNADGTLTYTPRQTAGTDTFTYTVRDSFGVVSNAATVTVIVLSANDILTVSRVEYIVSKKRWRIDGSSNVFGPGINTKVRIHNGPTATSPVIGIVPIDALGAFTFDSTTAPPPDTTQLVTLDSMGGGVLTTRVAFK